MYIQLPGTTDVVTCGRFEQVAAPGAASVGRFVYGQRYLARAEAVPLDPVHLPLVRGVEETAQLGGIFGALRDASPDNWGRRIIERALKRSPLTEVEYLLNAPQDGAGALTFGRASAPPPPVRPFNRVVHLEELMKAARAIENDPGAHELPSMLVEQIEQLIEPSTALGGARPKNAIVDGEQQWIAKFPMRNDRWNNAAVEAGMLTLAERCGIRVPPHRVVAVAGAPVLLVERFDRAPSGREDELFVRHRMVSALTVLGAEDYGTERTRWSYLLLADELARWSERPTKDAQELFRRAVFNCLISNTDDHPRNHALVAPTEHWRLAPAYDLTPSPIVGSQERRLAMTLGAEGQLATRANLLSEAPRYAVTREEGNAVIEEIVGVVRSNWESTLRRSGASERDVEAVRPAMLNPGFEF